jgi:acyl-coenzyme A synthetase/AMP-(fatty) acid ligase
LGEIESAARRAGCDSAAAVLADHHVALFVTPSDLNVNELRDFLMGNLPPYAIPRAVYPVEDLPTNENGKVDYGLLMESITRND